MKTPLIPLIANDFIAADGMRYTAFQLCRHRSQSPGLEAIALVDLNDNGEVERTGFVPRMKPREAAIIRLARKWQKRSIARRFSR